MKKIRNQRFPRISKMLVYARKNGRTVILLLLLLLLLLLFYIILCPI